MKQKLFINNCLHPLQIYDGNKFVECPCGLCKNCINNKNKYLNNYLYGVTYPKFIRNIIYFLQKIIPKKLQPKIFKNLIKKDFSTSTFSMEDLRNACK